MKKGYTKKFWKLMKILSLQIFLALTLFGVSIAHNNFAQILEKRISLSLTDVPFNEALKQLEQAADVKFAYSLSQLQTEENVTLVVKNKSLRSVFEQVFRPRKIKYTVHEKEGTIALKKLTPVEEEEHSYVPITTKVKVASITGVVTESTTKQPMPGVNILVKGTMAGATTDSDGKFTIEANEGDILIFSFIGFRTIEQRISSTGVMNVVLEPDVTSLEAVEINAGYYKTSKETQTGNIVKIASQDIAKSSVSNPLAALQAQVPGLEIIQQTGVPGGNFRVRIRGTNSLTNGNDPLYIIDGVPFISNTMGFSESSGEILGAAGPSPLNTINPSDIESIEVLKDADATAIYGSRGSNGVILITTKSGKAGKTKVDISVYTGVGQVASKMDLLSTSQYLQMRREALKNDNLTPSASNAPDLVLRDTTLNTDWQKELIGGTASTTDAQVSISGGTQNTQFSVGGGLHKETTVFPGSNSDLRISSHFKIHNTSSNQKFKTSFSLSYSMLNSDLLKTDLTSQSLTLSPTAPKPYNAVGELNWGATAYTSSFLNPLAHLRRSYEGQTKALFSSATMSYSITPDIDIKTTLGYTDSNMSAITLTPKSSFNPADAALVQNTTVFSNSNFQNWIVEPQASWRKKFSASQAELLVGSTFLDQTSQGTAQFATGFSSEALMRNIAAATTRTISSNYHAKYRYHAVFFRANYSLLDKYIINVTGRRDGSSRFGSGKQFANFGAIGAAWIFSKEEFISNNLSFLSFGKLRMSYGVTGNDQLGDYRYLDTYIVSNQYQNINGLAPARLNNPDFAWETNRKLELGLVTGFVKDKVYADISYYRNRSSNQLVGSPLPPTAGFPTIQSNFPAVIQNSGLEALIQTQNVDKGVFKWSSSINLTFPKNKLVEFPNLERFPSAISNRYIVDEAVTIVKQYHILGVDPSTGVYQIEDVNGDGSLNTADRQTVKFVGAKMYGAIQNTFEVGDFRFEFTFQYVNQNGYNYLGSVWTVAPGKAFNFPVEVLNRWTAEGDEKSLQRFGTQSSTQTPYDRYISSDQSIVDASFVRIKNLSASYSLPSNLLDRLHMTQARIVLQGQNLFTFTKYKGLDPETQNASLPPLRVVTIGFHLTL